MFGYSRNQNCLARFFHQSSMSVFKIFMKVPSTTINVANKNAYLYPKIRGSQLKSGDWWQKADLLVLTPLTSQGISITFMKFKVNFFHITWHVLQNMA